MKRRIILFNCLMIISLYLSCTKLDFTRLMDTSTDRVDISGTTVIVHGSVLDLGSTAIVSHGHCWSKKPEPTIADNSSNLGTIEGTGDFYSKLTNLTPGATYYVRSYLFDGNNYTYGTILSFQITGENIEFTTSVPQKTDAVNVQIKSSTTGIGSVQFNQHGHCWSQSETELPTINDSKTAYGIYKSDTTFVSKIINLNQGRYYIRGYLEADGYITYSNTVVYESKIEVSTDLVSIGSGGSAIANGTIKSLGVNKIKNYGHCWTTYTSTPDLNYLSEHNSLGSVNQIGSFSSELKNLISGRVYYFRAYATDGIKVYYGEIKNFIAN